MKKSQTTNPPIAKNKSSLITVQVDDAEADENSLPPPKPVFRQFKSAMSPNAAAGATRST